MNGSSQENILKIALEQQEVLTAYAYTILKDWDLAKDAYQDTMVAACKKHESLKPETLKAWLRKVTYFKAVDIIRSRSKSIFFDDETLTKLATHFETFMKDDGREEQLHQKQEWVNSCMQKVRPEARSILLSFYKEGNSCDIISELFNKSSNAIRLLLSRTRKQIRQCVSNKQMNAQ